MPKTTVIFLVMWAWSFFALAQSPVLRHYGAKDGLPSSEIYQAFQDTKGYMWFASDRGISKYDGYAFRTFSSSEGLPDNTVFKLADDARGRLWFETFSGNLGTIENNSISLFKYNNVIKKYFPSSIISNIVLDNDSNVWVNMNVGPLYKIVCFRKDGSLDTSMGRVTPGVRRVYVSKRGECMRVGTRPEKNIEIIDLTDHRLIARFTSPQTFSGQELLCKTHDGRTFICMDNTVFLLENGACTPVIISKNSILSFLIDGYDNIWIGYKDKGVEVYDINAGYKKKREMLKQYSVSSLLKDKDGAVWTTTLENGVYYMPPAALLSFTEDDGLTLPKIMRIENVDNNAIMIMSNMDVAIKAVDKPGLVILKKPPSVKGIDFKYCGPDRIFCAGQKKVNFPFQKKTISLGRPGKIYLGKKYIWVTRFDQIEVLSYTGGAHILWSINFRNISRVICLFEKKNGHLLVGTLDGLYEYDGNKVFPVNQLPLLSHRISDIKRINNDYLLVATVGHGLVLIKEDDYTRPVQFAEADGLPSVMCHVIYPESDTVAWVGTNKGLCRISHILDKARTKFLTIDMDDGLVSNEINDINIIGHKLWVATMNGLSILPLHPDSIVKHNRIPVYLEKITVNNQVVGKAGFLVLPYYNNEISMNFTALDYQHPGRLQYRYRLLPADTGWNYTSFRAVIYKSLAPGHYTFDLQVINPAGQISSGGVSYSFQILPPFWVTWWFIAVVTSGLFLGIYFLMQLRVRFIKNQVTLKSDLNTFKEKALRAQMNPHFIYNSLNSIQNYILKNEIAPSVSFLSKFSRLMRLTFSNTNISLVSLKDDVEALSLYSELENLRFNNRFEFKINISGDIQPDTVYVPPLMIQPFVENAVLHGLVTKEGKGWIQININKADDTLLIQVLDNGIGMKQASVIKDKKDKYKSRKAAPARGEANSGIAVTRARIEQAWKKTPEKSMFTITDLYMRENETGTMVEFSLPIIKLN